MAPAAPRRSSRKKARPRPYTTDKVRSTADKENDSLVNHHEISACNIGETSPMEVDDVVQPPSQALPVPAETGNISPTPTTGLNPRLVTRPTDERIAIAHPTYDDLTDVESDGEHLLPSPSYGR
jgi:hypothetical protein